MKKLILLLVGVLLFSVPTFAQLGGGGGFDLPDIAVTSVQAGGLDEIIVIENRDQMPMDLAGWRVVMGSPTDPDQHVYQFTEQCLLMPGAKLRLHSGIANFFSSGGTCEGSESDIVWNNWFALNDGAGVVTIYFADFVINQFGYPAKSVVINEVEINPEGADAGSEWVELYNASKTAVLLDEWSLGVANGVSIKLEIPLEGVLKPGEYLMIEVGMEFLNNQAERVELRRVDGSIVDETPQAGFMDTLDDGRCWARIPNGGPGWTFQHCTKDAPNMM